MPNYDYQCTHCHYEGEIFQSMSEAPLTRCPKCHLEHFVRRIGAGSGLIFKGSGFYTTDYRTSAPAVSDGATGHSCAKPNCCKK